MKDNKDIFEDVKAEVHIDPSTLKIEKIQVVKAKSENFRSNDFSQIRKNRKSKNNKKEQ